jgi:7-carboxy-7-deazaguanine synthase
MPYSVKEIFYTLQGEGAHTGRPAVFCRFTGCNLWSGREEDRATAVCRFCDTDFVGTNGEGGGRFNEPADLARAVAAKWPEHAARQPDRPNRPNQPNGAKRFVVCTGGEPLLQLDSALVDALHAEGFEVAIETNGTRTPPPGIDWICVSPKAGAELVLRSGDELKLVFPQEGADPHLFERLDFGCFYLQPMDGPDRARNTELSLRYCLEHPMWRLSLQTHKILDIP